jgi:hypothetical protein
MISTIDSSGFDTEAFDRCTRPVMRIFSSDQAKQIVGYQADSQLQQEIEELAEKSNEGTLSPAERAKYEGYVRANKFVAVLQAQARKRLAIRP